MKNPEKIQDHFLKCIENPVDLEKIRKIKKEEENARNSRKTPKYL